jgi:hypothetical protein
LEVRSDAPTGLDLDTLADLERAATPGPWNRSSQYGRVDVFRHPYAPGDSMVAEQVDAYDAALTVAARNALPDLIAAARERDRLLDEIETAHDDTMAETGRADEAETERDELRAKVAAVRAMHAGEPIEGSAVGPAWCSECGGGSPCATLLALGDQP